MIHRPHYVEPHPKGVEVLVHCVCGLNVKKERTSTDPKLIDCPQCVKGMAKHDRQTTPAAQLTIRLDISEREFHGIMASLRHTQLTLVNKVPLHEDIEEIFTASGTLTPLQVYPPFTQPDEFDLLCQRINSQARKQ